MGYQLVWKDDFNTVIDDTIWERVDPTIRTWLPCTNPNNVYTENGNLVLVLKNNICIQDPTRNYTYGNVRTKLSWLYGYFEARVKMGSGQYINNAFWLLGNNWTFPPEIDIYESAGYNITPTKIYGSIHYSLNGINNYVTNSYTGIDYSLDYHVFGMEWTPNFISWTTDGIETIRITNLNYPIPNIPMNIIFSMGRGWQGINPTSSVPIYSYIDYIKVFQQCLQLNSELKI